MAAVLACAWSARRTGLVEAEGGAVRLVAAEGQRFRLGERGEGRALGQLDGCLVQVEGPRLFRWLGVRSWRVLDAGDGSIPYVGLLRRLGGNWVLDDRSTGRPLVLEASGLETFAAWEGQLVLVSGMVVGAQTLRVRTLRSLEP
jgi:hypothetical protein